MWLKDIVVLKYWLIDKCFIYFEIKVYRDDKYEVLFYGEKKLRDCD